MRGEEPKTSPSGMEAGRGGGPEFGASSCLDKPDYLTKHKLFFFFDKHMARIYEEVCKGMNPCSCVRYIQCNVEVGCAMTISFCCVASFES